MRIEAENRRVDEGDIVTVPIWLRGAAKVANMNLDVQYDPNVARPEGEVLRGSLLEQAVFNVNAKEPGRVRIGFAQIDGISGDGTVANLPMRAVGRAGDRTALDLAVTALNDSVGHTLPIERVPGSVLIVGPEGQIPGDCDGDESITAADAMCALMMSVGNREVDPRMDVDGDTQVTSNDARLLLRRAVSLTQ